VLDPEDWEAFRTLARGALDDAIDYLRDARERPAWRDVPADVIARLSEPLPQDPQPLDLVYREFTQAILPYGVGNVHPRFLAWVHGTGTPTGVLADLLASAMNVNCGGRNHGAVYVERQVIAWMREAFGFPDEASGVLTMGTSASNLIAVLVARLRALGPEVRRNGVSVERDRLVGYASAAAHSCIRRAFETAGLGSAALRTIALDADGRIDLAALRQSIAVDRSAGFVPFFLVGTAGTVDVGAIDPLDELADIAAAQRIWFHVDGAFGATAIFAPSVAPRLRGIERADSLAFDFHKWLHVPYSVGCVLVRDEALHRETFSSPAAYLSRAPRGTAAASPWFTDYCLDLSRGFHALKVWFTLKEFGTRRLGEAIESNLVLAQRLAAAVKKDARFELMAPVQLQIVCFRYRFDGADDATLDALNDELAIRVQESGVAVISTTTLGERQVLRVNFTNHRTTASDVDLLVETLRDLGDALKAEGIVS
jgi:aromatic-L-amino-acid decarboxylase